MSEQPWATGGFGEPRTEEELAILLLDGSGSMSSPEAAGSGRTKADAVREVVGHPDTGLLALFKLRSRRANLTHFSIVVFDTWVESRLGPTPAAQIDLASTYSNLDLLRGHGKETDIAGAINRAYDEAEQFLTPMTETPRYSTVLLMSDGVHNVPSEDPAPVVQAADRLKSVGDSSGGRPRVVLACAPYGPDADHRTLERVASGPSFYRPCSTAEELRAFFIATLRSKPQA